MQHDEECDELVETVKQWILLRADKAKPIGNLKNLMVWLMVELVLIGNVGVINKLKCGLEKKRED